ncbi:MAG: hypothetical protein HQL34_10910, partial [Alphaproteobacteria bacterium]|nr:hypothetical protein [Alphaproteobacteria bacterium]
MRDSHIAENGGEENLPDAWLVDVSRSGPRCVLEGRRVVLWRADDAKEQPVEIATADGSWRAGTKWPARSQRLAPPDKMPLTDGGKLTVRVGDAKADIDVTIIPASVKDATVQAAWMAEKGCRPQAVALLGKAR